MENSFSRHSRHTASRKPHLTSLNRIAFDRKQNPFVYFVVMKLEVHSSIARCPNPSPKECSFWKTLSPDTLGTLLQRNHAFIRKQTLSCFSRLLNSWFIVLLPVPGLFTKGMLLFENSFSRHSRHTASRKPQPHFPESHSIHRKQNPFVYFVVMKLEVHSSIARCPNPSPKECSLWKTPSPDTPGTLLQKTTSHFPESHSIHQKTKPFRVFRGYETRGSQFSIARCPGSSPKECSLWKTPAPDTLGTLLQENHTFIRKQNPFVFFVVIKLVVHSSLASCPGSSPKECFF